jgi:hypothetical protein
MYIYKYKYKHIHIYIHINIPHPRIRNRYCLKYKCTYINTNIHISIYIYIYSYKYTSSPNPKPLLPPPNEPKRSAYESPLDPRSLSLDEELKPDPAEALIPPGLDPIPVPNDDVYINNYKLHSMRTS